MRKTLVIAECGSCHDGELTKALALIDTARECGASAAKFQFWSSAARLAARRHAPELASVYARYQVPREWLSLLAEKAKVAGIGFMCTAYLPEDVATIAPFVAHFKIASFEATAVDLLDAHQSFIDDDVRQRRDRLVIISRGMGNDGSTIAQCIDHGTRGPRVRHLHCVSAYPTPLNQLALRRIEDDQLDGFSDHSAADQTWTGALAVAAGASIIERHLRLDETRRDNPDYPHAMSPRGFREYVQHVRFAETCGSNGARERQSWQPCEEPLLKYRVTGDV